MNETNKRIEYIDALRGLTMILVVFSHIEVFSIPIESTIIGEIFRNFRMPLFFFISGYISYKHADISNLTEWLNKITKKVKIQLLPTILFGLIFAYFYSHSNFDEFISHKNKFGYWFTICLLYMFVILYSVNFVTSKKRRALVLVITSILLYACKTIFINNKTLNCIGNIFCLHQLFLYFHYFITGYIAALYKGYFNKALNNQYILISCIIIFAASSYLSINYDDAEWKFGVMRIYRLLSLPLLGYTGIFIVYNYFRVYQDLFSSNKRIGRTLQYIGKRTLDIYLLHYFFLPQLPQLAPLINNSCNIVIELFICITLSLMIICICLIVSNILRTSPIIAKKLFGAK